MTRVWRLLMAAAVVVAGPLLMSPGVASAAPKPALTISEISVDGGELRFLATARAQPAGMSIARNGIGVTVGGRPLNVQSEQSNAKTGVPARTLIVILDASVDADLAAAKAAAERATDDLPPDVSVGLIVANDQAVEALPPTQDRDAYAQALAAVTAGTANRPALIDAIVRAARTLGSTPGDSDRRVLVLTDGNDASIATAASARGELASAEVILDVVSLDFVTGADEAGIADLAGLATATGGRAVRANTAGEATAASAIAAYPPVVAVRAYVPRELIGESIAFTVTVPGSGLTATAEVLTAASGGSPVEFSYAWVPAWAAWLVGAVLFVGIVAAVLAVLWPRSAKYERIKQIANFGPGRTALATKPTVDASAGSVIARTALAATASVVRSGQMEARITHRLERAGMRLRAAEWVLLRLCLTVATGALLFAVADLPGGVMGLIIGWLLTLLYQSVRIDRRMAAFAEQLPDALQLMIGSLRSGFSLPQSLDALVREAPEPVGAEFGRALAEHRLGADVSDALERVAQRTESEDLGWAVMAVRIQREVGGNLAEVLQTTVDTMRERSRLRRHVLALSAEGRISAWVLIGLPIVLAIFMFMYRRDYMAPLVSDPVGITMLIGGGLLFVVGIFWLTRVVKVDA